MKKKALIICYSHHNSEPRLLKVINALTGEFEFITAGYSGINGNTDVKFIRLTNNVKRPRKITFHHNKPVMLRKFGSLYEKVYKYFFHKRNGFFFSQTDYEILKKNEYQLIIAHHPDSIELGVKLSKHHQAKLVMNCHEYYPMEFDNNPVWMKYDKPIIEKILHTCKKDIQLWLTVSKNIDIEYENNFGANTFLLYNSKPYLDLSPSKVDPNEIKIIHHGAAMSERKIEQMIEVFAELPSCYSLHLMLMPSDINYLNNLKATYAHVKKLYFVNPVPVSEISTFINKFDIGLFFLSDEIYNYKYCLPNKLFEFIQARLCVVVTPNPEMKELVEKYKIGKVSNSYSHSDCVEALKSLTIEDITKAKQNCEFAAKELDSLNNEEELLKVMNQLCVA